MRQIKVTVNQPGFELFFRDIKTTMGMDILRCKTPIMVQKEIAMHFIAYNCIRRLMFEASIKRHVNVNRISFKGSIQALRQWEPHINNVKITPKDSTQLLLKLYDSIANIIVLERPGRNEPRCIKRKPNRIN